MSERQQGLVFGEDAALYDRARPSYPAELVDALVALVGGRAGVLDVGCGTGKAARLLAARGMSGIGVEAHPAMAAVARDRLAATSTSTETSPEATWRVDVSSFEEWQPRDDDTPVDLVTCAQAWHWLDPDVRLRKARDVLRPGGWLALWWNTHDEDHSPIGQAIATAYRRHAPTLDGPPGLQRTADGVRRTGDDHVSDSTPDDLGFGPAVERDLPWRQTYSAAEYVAMLRTHSNHRMLAPDKLDGLLDAVAAAIDDHGGIYDHGYTCRLWAVQRRATR